MLRRQTNTLLAHTAAVVMAGHDDIRGCDSIGDSKKREAVWQARCVPKRDGRFKPGHDGGARSVAEYSAEVIVEYSADAI
jgi:hypothetical protein